MPAAPASPRRHEQGSDGSGTPWAVRATAALAWLLATLCFAMGGSHWLSADGTFGDLAFAVLMGTGAAYLGMSLTRKAAFAWHVCRKVALFSGAINTVTMPLFLIAWAAGAVLTPFSVPDVSASTRAIMLLTAFISTVTPWAVFVALGDDRVRRWIDAEEATCAR